MLDTYPIAGILLGVEMLGTYPIAGILLGIEMSEYMTNTGSLVAL